MDSITTISQQALLLMDIQTAIVHRYGDSTDLIKRLNQAIDGARQASAAVIFVRIAFRPGYPEANTANRTFRAIVRGAGDNFTEESSETQLHQQLHRQPEDPVVLKKRVSAFAGSDLEILLRSLHLTHLVLTGISTSGVVLSTLREASDRDYQLTVLSDGCADADEEVHRVLTTKVFPRQAEVMRVDEWVAGLRDREQEN